MSKIRILLSCVAAVSALIFIVAEYIGPAYLSYIFKPLTMLGIIAVAVMDTCEQPGFYGKVLIGGLLCSFAGDIFLMVPENYFIAGLISFLIGHIFYIVAFTNGRFMRSSILSLLPFVLYGIFMFRLLAPFLGGLLWPVSLYLMVILIMGWQAWERWSRLRKTGAALAFVGAIFFIISDSVLAYNKFRTHIEFGRALNLSTYFLAQWLIAWSIHRQSESSQPENAV